MGEQFKYWLKSSIPSGLVRYRLDQTAAEKTALLTFDDGPAPGHTLQVLDILDRYNIRAIFFVPGHRVNRDPQALKEIVRRGHVLGNHTFSHVPDPGYSIARWSWEIGRCQVTLNRETGSEPRYFRPPFGQMSVSMLAAAMYHNLYVMHWSYDVGEYSDLRAESPDVIAARWVERMRDRDIVLLHDESEKTAEVLEIALPQLLAKGFRFDGLAHV